MVILDCFAMFALLPVGTLWLADRNVLLADMNLWYALPLIVSVSLVCAATRHEQISPILSHAIRFALWIAVFMGAVMALLAGMDWLS